MGTLWDQIQKLMANGLFVIWVIEYIYLLFISIHDIYILFNVFIGRNVLTFKFGNILPNENLNISKKMRNGKHLWSYDWDMCMSN